jgi:hypothetical protein
MPLAMIRPDLAAGRLVQLSEVSVLEDHGYHLLSGPGAMGVQARRRGPSVIGPLRRGTGGVSLMASG